RDEVSFALSRQKRVIPVLYLDCDIPFRLARLQYIDFRPDYARGLKILLRALGVVETVAAQPAAPVVAPEQIARTVEHEEVVVTQSEEADGEQPTAGVAWTEIIEEVSRA